MKKILHNDNILSNYDAYAKNSTSKHPNPSPQHSPFNSPSLVTLTHKNKPPKINSRQNFADGYFALEVSKISFQRVHRMFYLRVACTECLPH